MADNTIWTEFARRDPVPRTHGVATSTEEKATLSAPLVEFRGVGHAISSGVKEAIADCVGERESELVVGGPSLLATLTQSLTGNKTASLAARPSPPEDSPHAALKISIGATSNALRRASVAASAAVWASTIPEATAPSANTLTQLSDRPSAQIPALSVASASCAASSPLSFVCDATSWVASMQHSVAAVSVLTASTSTMTLQTRPQATVLSRVLVVSESPTSSSMAARSTSISDGIPDYDHSGEGSVQSDIGTNRAELQRHDPGPRALGVATSTEETPALSTYLDRFHGDFNAMRYCNKKDGQHYVKERVITLLTGAPILIAPSTRSHAGVAYAYLTAAPSSYGLSPNEALTVSTGTACAAAHRALTITSAANVIETVASAAAPLSGTRVQRPGDPSAQRFASTAAPPDSRTASTQSFVAAATTWVSPVRQLVALAPVLMALTTNRTRPPVPPQSRIPVLEFAMSSGVDCESIAQFAGPAPTSSIFTSLPVIANSYGPSAASAQSLLPPQGAGVTLDVLKGLLPAAEASEAVKIAVPRRAIPQPAPEPVMEPAPPSVAPSSQIHQFVASLSAVSIFKQMRHANAGTFPFDPGGFLQEAICSWNKDRSRRATSHVLKEEEKVMTISLDTSNFNDQLGFVCVAPLDDFTWTGDPDGDLVRECTAMVKDLAGSLQRQMHCPAYLSSRNSTQIGAR